MPAPVAVTGANGRLGRAVVAELRHRDQAVAPLARAEYDLDDPLAAQRCVSGLQPRLVIHCAAWTDVDGCAREPELALRRNGAAVRELAAACVRGGSDLVVVSTNEVFDGERADGLGYREDDPVNPVNPYGASKLAGEVDARAAFEGQSQRQLWIIRTAWLYGPPGNDFPAKIVAAADRLPRDEPLKVVADEIGSPSYTPDVASGLVELVAAAPPGTYHLAGHGPASRYDVAAAVLARCRPDRPLAPISRSAFVRASNPPAWAVLDCSRAASHGVRLRPWDDALAEYVAAIC